MSADKTPLTKPFQAGRENFPLTGPETFTVHFRKPFDTVPAVMLTVENKDRQMNIGAYLFEVRTDGFDGYIFGNKSPVVLNWIAAEQTGFD